MSFWVSRVRFGFVLVASIVASTLAGAQGFDFEAPGIALESAGIKKANEQIMPLSAIKRVSNDLRIDRRVSANGERNNFLYRAEDSVSLNQATAFYRALIEEQGSIEFECAQRSCGPSNNWANDIFGNRNLVGRDSNQFYFAGRIDDGLHQGWLSVYSVENARRIPYIYLSFIPAPPADHIADAKRGVLLGASLISESWNQALADYLAQNQQARLVVVGYSKPPGSDFVSSEDRSMSFAQNAVATWLANLDLTPERLEVRAMGSLGQKPLGSEAAEWAYLYLVD